MELDDIIPLDQMEAKLGQKLLIKRIQTADREEICATNPDDLFGIASSAWNRIVISGHYSVNPQQMAKFFNAKDPALAFAIEQVLQQLLIKEFGAMMATIQHRKRLFVVAQSSVAHLFSDELHFFDIKMEDPRYRLQGKAQKSDIHKYRGFGLLDSVMSNVFTAARERHCHTVTLTAYCAPLAKVFHRYGFEVEHSLAG